MNMTHIINLKVQDVTYLMFKCNERSTTLIQPSGKTISSTRNCARSRTLTIICTMKWYKNKRGFFVVLHPTRNAMPPKDQHCQQSY